MPPKPVPVVHKQTLFPSLGSQGIRVGSRTGSMGTPLPLRTRPVLGSGGNGDEGGSTRGRHPGGGTTGRPGRKGESPGNVVCMHACAHGGLDTTPDPGLYWQHIKHCSRDLEVDVHALGSGIAEPGLGAIPGMAELRDENSPMKSNLESGFSPT